jgi:hypothetical protein
MALAGVLGHENACRIDCVPGTVGADRQACNSIGTAEFDT